MQLKDVSAMNKELRLYINNTFFMNRIKTEEFPSLFDEFYKEGMDLAGVNGFDLFDEFCRTKSLQLNKTPIVLGEGKTFLEKMYGENVYSNINLIVQELKVNSNFTFTESYIKRGCAFSEQMCKELAEGKEYRKPKLKALVSEAFGMAAMLD